MILDGSFWKTRQKKLLACRQLQSNTITPCTNSDEKLKVKATRQGESEIGFLRVGQAVSSGMESSY
jgi:hypothetical protein